MATSLNIKKTLKDNTIFIALIKLRKKVLFDMKYAIK